MNASHRRHARNLLVVGAITVLAACSAAPDGGWIGDGGNDINEFQAACRSAVESTRTEAQVDYPRTLSAEVDVPITYELVVDTNEHPLPPDQYVTTDDPTSTGPVWVECRLAARLTADDAARVDIAAPPPVGDGGWVGRSVNGAGLFQWRWSVTAHRPDLVRLGADIRPVSLDASQPTDEVYTVTTPMTVGGTFVQKAAWWVETNKVAAGSIAAVVAASLLALIRWSGQIVEAVKQLAAKIRGAEEPAAKGATAKTKRRLSRKPKLGRGPREVP
jgi:hypothetical protein